MRRIHADLLLLFAALIWGLAFVFQKTAMSVIGPLTFIAARSIVASLALAPFAWREAQRSSDAVPRAFYRIPLWGGVAFFLAAVFQQFGLLTATVTNTGFLTALYVVIVPFMAWFWTRNRPSPVVWPAAALSFVGMWLLGGGTVSALTRGDLLVVICAFFWAVHVIVTSRASAYDRPFLFTYLQFVIVAALGLIGALATETISFAGLRQAWLEIAYVGLLSSAFTFTLLTVAMRYAPPSEAAIIVSTENLFGALFGALMLGERLGFINWTGAVLILIATMLVQLAPHWFERRTTDTTALKPNQTS